MLEVKTMKTDQLDNWWAINPPQGSIAYGIDECDKKYLAIIEGKEKPVWRPLEWFVLNKRQYTFIKSNDIYTISTYYEGTFLEKHIFLYQTQAEKYISQLEENGYEIAFTKEQIQGVKEKYNYMNEHKLIGEDYDEKYNSY